MIAPLLALALVAVDARPAAVQKVAVWSIQATQGVAPSAVQVLEDVVATELAKTGRFQVIGRGDLTAVLSYAQQQRALGCGEAACLSELGATVGAELVLSGQAGQLGSQYRLSLMLVDAKKAVAVARAARFTEPTEDALAAVVPAVVADLVAAAPAPGLRDAATTGPALLERAGALSRQGKHAEAAAEYDRYPAAFPEGKERCLAAFQAGAEWEAAGKRPAAAERFLAVGSDAACQQAGPNAAASALARAGRLYDGLGWSDQARDAYRRLVALPGISDPSVKAKVDMARMRLESDPAPR